MNDSLSAQHDPRGLRLEGAFTALVTPFAADGALDETSWRDLLARQLDAGIDGVVVGGTTGESATLSPSERDRLLAAAVELRDQQPWKRRVTVVAGTGTNDTAFSVRTTQRAAALGADAALVVVPYYNRPDQRMLDAHFRAIADEGGLPVIVYNVPSRTGANIDPDTFLRLAEHPRVVGLKEASGNLEQIARVCRYRPPEVAVLSGDDAATLAVLAMGGNGVVSVASNQIPGEMAALCAAARNGDWRTARRLHERWLPLMIANFRGGPNPVPAKAALALMGILPVDALRAPLLPLEQPARERLTATLRDLGLLAPEGDRLRPAPTTESQPASTRQVARIAVGDRINRRRIDMADDWTSESAT